MNYGRQRVGLRRNDKLFLWSQVLSLLARVISTSWQFSFGAAPPNISQSDRRLWVSAPAASAAACSSSCIRVSCNLSNIASVPADHINFAFHLLLESCIRDSKQMSCNDPSWRHSQLASDQPTTLKQSVSRSSQPSLSRNQRTTSEFGRLKHCRSCGNSKVTQKQRPKVLATEDSLELQATSTGLTNLEELTLLHELPIRHIVFLRADDKSSSTSDSAFFAP